MLGSPSSSSLADVSPFFFQVRLMLQNSLTLPCASQECSGALQCMTSNTSFAPVLSTQCLTTTSPSLQSVTWCKQKKGSESRSYEKNRSPFSQRTPNARRDQGHQGRWYFLRQVAYRPCFPSQGKAGAPCPLGSMLSGIRGAVTSVLLVLPARNHPVATATGKETSGELEVYNYHLDNYSFL